jgi:hypothetical protein
MVPIGDRFTMGAETAALGASDVALTLERVAQTQKATA